MARSAGEAASGAPTVRRTIFLAVAVNTVTSLPFPLLGAAAVNIEADLGFDEARLGVLLAVMSLGGLIASPLAGLVVERAGPSNGLRLATALVTASALGIAVIGRSWWVVAVLLLIAGFSSGTTAPAANLWISHTVPRARQGIALGFKQCASSLGGVISGLAVPAIIITAGWRWAFVAAAAAAAAVYLCIPTVRAPSRAVAQRARSGALVARRPLVVTTLAMFFGFVALSPLQAFYVASAVDDGISEGRAGLLLAIGSIVSVAARLTAGILVDRHQRGALGALVVMLSCGGLCYLVIALGSPAMIVAITPIAFATAFSWTGLMHVAVLQAYRDAPARATGFVMIGAYGGNVLGPILFGALARGSYTTAWSVSACLLLASSAVVAVVRPRLLELRDRQHRVAVAAL